MATTMRATSASPGNPGGAYPCAQSLTFYDRRGLEWRTVHRWWDGHYWRFGARGAVPLDT